MARRLDVPRDCQEHVAQRLGGRGPFGLQEDESGTNGTFVETGPPLTCQEWDDNFTQDIMTRGKAPPGEVENNRAEENMGMESAGLMLDVRGCVTTSEGGMKRQMESARQLVQTRCDQLTVIMPSCGDPTFLDGDAAKQKKDLLDLIDQRDKIGKIHEQLGVANFVDDSAVQK
jgi:hypothetical protein